MQVAFTTASEALTQAVKGAQAREAKLSAARDAAAAQATSLGTALEAATKQATAALAEKEVLAKRNADLEAALLAKSQAHREEVAGLAAQLEAARRAAASAAAAALAAPASSSKASSSTTRAPVASSRGGRGGAAAASSSSRSRGKAATTSGAAAATLLSESEDADFEPDIVVGRAVKPAHLSGPPPLPRSGAGSAAKGSSSSGVSKAVPATWSSAMQALLPSSESEDDALIGSKGPVKRVRFEK